MIDINQTQALFEIYGIHMTGFDGLCLECKQPAPCRTRAIIDSRFEDERTEV